MKADKLLGHLGILAVIIIIAAGTLTPILRADQATDSLNEIDTETTILADADAQDEVVEWRTAPVKQVVSSSETRPYHIPAKPETDQVDETVSTLSEGESVESLPASVLINTTLMADCQTLERATRALMRAQVSRSESTFTDEFTNEPVARCQLLVDNAQNVADVSALAANILDILEARGWEEDPTYIAEGPGETSLALQQAEATAFLQVRWQADQQGFEILLEETPLAQ